MTHEPMHIDLIEKASSEGQALERCLLTQALLRGFDEAEELVRSVCRDVLTQWEASVAELQGRGRKAGGRADFFVPFGLLLDFAQGRPRWRWMRRFKAGDKICSEQIPWTGGSVEAALRKELAKLQPRSSAEARARRTRRVHGVVGRRSEWAPVTIAQTTFDQLVWQTISTLRQVEYLREVWKALKEVRRNAEKVWALTSQSYRFGEEF